MICGNAVVNTFVIVAASPGCFLIQIQMRADTCPECDAITDYMRSVGIIPTAQDEPDGEIPF